MAKIIQSKLIFGVEEFLHTWYSIFVVMQIISSKKNI